MLEKHKFFTFSHALPLYNVVFLSTVSNASYIFSILDRTLKVFQLFHLLGINTNPVRPDPDRHALDADPVPNPAK
jgi:hypothetical protein